MYNVMKEAHKQARKLISKRPMPYKVAFCAALSLCHSHGKRLAKLAKAGTVNRNTHELKEGDVIRHYGCLLWLKAKRVYECPHDVKGVAVFDSVCLTREADSAMPVHWVEREGGYTVQGNDRATWSLVVE